MNHHLGAVLSFLTLVLQCLVTNAETTPISDRDYHLRPIDQGKPEVFKCRAVAAGATFAFAHEWIHYSADTNCNLILLDEKFTEERWSDIIHQSYRLQNHLEHIPANGNTYAVNHKLPV